MPRPKRKEREQSNDDEDYREVESEYEEDDQTIQRKKNSKKNLKSKRKRQDKVEESETEEEEEEETSAKKIAKKHSKEKGKKQKVKHMEDSESEEETTPKKGGTISWDYVRACENLDQIGSYDWAKEVGSFLKKSIKALKKKNSKSSYGNTGGCVLIILYWFCQKTEKIKPISGREKEVHGMRKWDIQRLIQNWTSFNSLKKLTKIFEKLKEDRKESESEEEENNSDEAKTASEGEEKGDDDQEVEVVEQETASEKSKWEKQLQKKEEKIRCLTVEKDNLQQKLKEKEQELTKFAEDKVDLEERNATLVTENFCLASLVKELEEKVKKLEQMLSPKTHTSPAAQQHNSPPPNSTEENNESNTTASKAAENTEKRDQSTVEEGQSQGIFTVEESAATAAQSPPHCTVQEETQSTPPSQKDSLFQTPTVCMLTVEEMEKQPDMFQIVKSPEAARGFPLHTLSLVKEQKTPEENKKGELTMRLTEQHSGETVSSMGLYSYVVRLKNRKRTQKNDSIYCDMARDMSFKSQNI
ncbi:uncharacterized protein LOC133744399 [Rosa rugosa]|uniref:uncharacterized protein LOC133744399 n=1 Tax=Rosa rugosa TaxID=74645 RepID=UPI002B40AC79|nr:uncharacterized protein LOC133744399 [Rosa rugosa]